MRILLSKTGDLSLTRKAVEKAREMGFSWAGANHMALQGEGPDDNDAWLEALNDWNYPPLELPRHSSQLLELFDIMGEEMSVDPLYTVEIPDDVTYSISSYISEWVEEKHRKWDKSGERTQDYCFDINSEFK